MKVLNAHITWRALPTCEFISGTAEVFIDGLGSVTISDFLSEETRKIVYDEIVAAAKAKIEGATKSVEDI